MLLRGLDYCDFSVLSGGDAAGVLVLTNPKQELVLGCCTLKASPPEKLHTDHADSKQRHGKDMQVYGVSDLNILC